MLISVRKINRNIIVESYVPARCATKPYHVILILNDKLKLEKTACDCGVNFCPHALKLYTHFMAELEKGKIELNF